MIRFSWHHSSKWHNPIMYTDWQWLIRAAWGRRRVSSRAAPGTVAYPTSLAATRGMWWSWYLKNRSRKEYHVVISDDKEGGHGQRFAAEIAAKEAAEIAVLAKANMALRLEGLQAERAAARSAGDFARADALRDEIEKAGFVVGDAAIAKEGGQ